MTDTNPVLELRNVNKSFGPIDVLHDISLKVNAGEVLCLLGDNGAGKSTLIKTLAGVHKPTRKIGPFKVFDRKTANETAVEAVQAMGITRIDDGDRLIGGLSGGERQSLAIARAVHFGARVLILDEPTAALGVKQASHVLRIVLEARKRGLAVIFITHQVTHAMAVGDHFAVLIRGALAANFMKGEKTREEITDLMAGGEALASLDMETGEGPDPQTAHTPAPAL
ncbi:ABC transporter ATP-binding protein (plasmid) [Marinovum sp. KMM 9989]